MDNKHQTEESYLKQFGLPTNRPLKAILTGKEKDVYSMIQRLQTIKNLKDKKSNEVKKEFNLNQKKKEDEIIKKQKSKERNKRIKEKSKKKEK